MSFCCLTSSRDAFRAISRDVSCFSIILVLNVQSTLTFLHSFELPISLRPERRIHPKNSACIPASNIRQLFVKEITAKYLVLLCSVLPWETVRFLIYLAPPMYKKFCWYFMRCFIRLLTTFLLAMRDNSLQAYIFIERFQSCTIFRETNGGYSFNGKQINDFASFTFAIWFEWL